MRIRIGVTGHRDVVSNQRLIELLGRIRRLVPESETTLVRLGVVSALAEGADRLVVDEVFEEAAGRAEEARLEVVLPFERGRYIELQEFSIDARAEFEAWLDRATTVIELGGPWAPKAREAAYEAAGRHVVNRCDVLVALWDGRPSGGRGGTAETLLYAAELGKPCFWIATEGDSPCPDNLAEGHETTFLEVLKQRAAVPTADPHGPSEPRRRVLAPLEEMRRNLDAFNKSLLPPVSVLRRRLERELGPLDEGSKWVTGPFVRATFLADRYQSRFMLATWLMSILAAGAAASLGAGVTREDPSPIWAWAEVGCLLTLAAVFFWIHRQKLHRRWLSYRLLAERFRSAYYMAPTGIDFRRAAGLEAVFVERRSSDWLIRAFEEVWDSRPHAVGPPQTPSDREFDSLKLRLANEWIGRQIAYHAKARRRHEQRGLAFTWLILLLFFGAVLFAMLHAATDVIEAPTIFLSITLPVAAAAVGVILTARQHRALAERYGRMHSDLVSIRRSLLDADAQTIGKTTSEGARVIAEENGDWFGAMWFLDVEHPP